MKARRIRLVGYVGHMGRRKMLAKFWLENLKIRDHSKT
jgi:hypothetical protein